MLKAKKTRVALLILPLILCLYLSGIAVGADPCFQGFSTIPGSVQYNESWILQCDPNNADGIDPGESITISVSGGRPIYLWSVIGNGFRLEHDQTKGLSNTLQADTDACGTAMITVADQSGKEGASSIVTCSVTCGPESDLKWDLENPGGIVPSSQITLTVLDGRAPFTWKLTQGYDKGFLLDETATGPTSTLTANANICETAEIKVTDSCSGEVNGSVKAVICTGIYATDDYWEITPYTVPFSRKLIYYRTFYDCNDGSFISQEHHYCVCSSDICERIIRHEYVVDWDNRACSNPTGYNMCGNATYCLSSSEYCGQETFWCAGQVYIGETPCDE